MRRNPAIVFLSACLCAATASLTLCGCIMDESRTTGWASGARTGTSLGSVEAVEAAFEPVRLRIHPLTHVDVGDDPASQTTQREPQLVLHYELRDQFTDPVKGLGVLRIEARPQRTRLLALPDVVGASPADDAPAGDVVSWDVADLLDPKTNSLRYDPATRTYRVSLRVPAWFRAWVRSDAGAKPMTLRATLTTARPDGTRRVLSDEFVLER